MNHLIRIALALSATLLLSAPIFAQESSGDSTTETQQSEEATSTMQQGMDGAMTSGQLDAWRQQLLEVYRTLGNAIDMQAQSGGQMDTDATPDRSTDPTDADGSEGETDTAGQEGETDTAGQEGETDTAGQEGETDTAGQEGETDTAMQPGMGDADLQQAYQQLGQVILNISAAQAQQQLASLQGQIQAGTADENLAGQVGQIRSDFESVTGELDMQAESMSGEGFDSVASSFQALEQQVREGNADVATTFDELSSQLQGLGEDATQTQ